MMNVNDFEVLAADLGVESATLQAVAEVESGRNGGFLPDGRAVILFEAHIFWRQLCVRGINPAKYVEGNGDILSPKWNRRLYRGGAAEWERLAKAEKIDRAAALEATSWGAFQIMGFNSGLCGAASVEEFVGAIGSNKEVQLELFAVFLKNSGMVELLRKKDWINFAKRYNGKGYAVNRYDERIREAYERYSRQT